MPEICVGFRRDDLEEGLLPAQAKVTAVEHRAALADSELPDYIHRFSR
jgi:hypothetical protein